MDIRKETLWKVPLFCVIAGVLVNILCVHVLLRMAFIKLPDGAITMDTTRWLIIYGAMFLGTLLIGGLVRNMTRKEIFFSASIVVLYGVILMLIQWAFHPSTNTGLLRMIYLLRLFEWCTFVSEIFFRLNDNIWFGIVLKVMTPYLFVLFGKRVSE